MSTNVKIISMNCRGLNGRQKRRDVIHYLRKKNASIICLQDVHFTDNMETIVKAEWGGEVCFSSFTSNSRGVAIFINNNLDYKIHNLRVSTEHPLFYPVTPSILPSNL